MKTIAVTMGEPGGIGPEVALKALHELKGICVPVIVGDMAVIEEAVELLKLPIELRSVDTPPEGGGAEVLQVVDVGRFAGFGKGTPTAEGGRASVACIKKAVELAMQGLVGAIVTAPISKESLKMAGYPWPGHTEMLAGLTGAEEYGMMLMGGSGGRHLRVMLTTIHVALRDVPGLITRESVFRAVRLAGKACRMLGIAGPRIAVAGLNPHAGEGGMFGAEEAEIISPAVEEARAAGMPVSGPYPPDTLYYRAWKGEFDMVVSMYHDQGLVPLKLIAFERGVNVTVGLPIIRTSPDHGTAYDIAWQGKADPSSMVEAVKAAISLRL
jgi:4-hydroxythreonine-4-phosphate dehydrogenase